MSPHVYAGLSSLAIRAKEPSSSPSPAGSAGEGTLARRVANGWRVWIIPIGRPSHAPAAYDDPGERPRRIAPFLLRPTGNAVAAQEGISFGALHPGVCRLRYGR